MSKLKFIFTGKIPKKKEEYGKGLIERLTPEQLKKLSREQLLERLMKQPDAMGRLAQALSAPIRERVNYASVARGATAVRPIPSEGPLVGWTSHETIGIGIHNPRSLTRTEIHTDEDAFYNRGRKKENKKENKKDTSKIRKMYFNQVKNKQKFLNGENRSSNGSSST